MKIEKLCNFNQSKQYLSSLSLHKYSNSGHVVPKVIYFLCVYKYVFHRIPVLLYDKFFCKIINFRL